MLSHVYPLENTAASAGVLLHTHTHTHTQSGGRAKWRGAGERLCWGLKNKDTMELRLDFP